MAAASAALFAAPTAASAAPTGTVTPVTQNQAAPTISGTASSEHTDAGIAAVFDCRYFSRAPFQTVQFTCLVRSGHVKVVVNCADGRRVSGPLLGPRPNWQTFNVSCAPARFTTFDFYTRG
ncbi:hypothetical protein [Streptomyces sp. AN091965]|uniref:hypothetical protein n=1 Tax=Streptomyces sp. AN091965 TaxID=2927803 RepID=UPI001F61ED9C|nr:hypothetical protein [Streptomyces sp. AN091965]MCI3927705.1 hypothetical protein [Streptomyces sp. AN091965]MCI3927722.1 hypothetical protein [Streptomyces sp. AN091965]